MKIHYLFCAETITSPTFTKGLLEVPEINSHWLTDLNSLLITAEIQSWDVSGGLKHKIPFVPRFLLQDLKCQPQTRHRAPCPAHGQATRGSFGMSQCVFCCLFSEQPKKPKPESISPICTPAGALVGSEVWFWICCPHPLLLLGCLAQVREVWIPYRGNKTGLSQSTSGPWSSSDHGSDLQLQVLHQLFCCTACQCRSSLQVWFSPLVEGIYMCKCLRCQTLSYSANIEIQT